MHQGLEQDWILINSDELNTEHIAVQRFREYLRIKTVQPNPDYIACAAFLKNYALELGLQYNQVEVINTNMSVLKGNLFQS